MLSAEDARKITDNKGIASTERILAEVYDRAKQGKGRAYIKRKSNKDAIIANLRELGYTVWETGTGIGVEW